MNLLKVPISDVQPWDKNPRGIKTKDYERLKKQITKLGVYKPLLAFRENGGYVVLGGNMRIRALKELGFKEVDISVVDAPTEPKKIEYALSDNDRVGYYEEDKLAELIYPHIADLDLSEFKVDLGEAIDLKQVVERYGPDIDDGADEVPEVDDTPAVTKMGDLFTLGKHRLMCGDSTKAEDVARLMRGEKAQAVVTDPPFNVRDDKWDTFEGDEAFVAFTSKWLAQGKALADTVVCFMADKNVPLLRVAGEKVGIPYRRALIWRKPPGSQFAGASLDGFWYDFEIIQVFGKPTFKPRQDTQMAVLEHRTVTGQEHGCEKPPALLRQLIDGYSESGQIVLDPFLGSGTTLIAAEKTGRVCYGMEIDPKYCDVIIKRYADYAKVSEDSIRATRETA